MDDRKKEFEKKIMLYIGKKFKEKRVEKNLSQGEVRKGISQSTISHLEVGYRLPKLEVLKEIANELVDDYKKILDDKAEIDGHTIEYKIAKNGHLSFTLPDSLISHFPRMDEKSGNKIFNKDKIIEAKSHVITSIDNLVSKCISDNFLAELILPKLFALFSEIDRLNKVDYINK